MLPERYIKNFATMEMPSGGSTPPPPLPHPSAGVSTVNAEFLTYYS